MNNEFLQAYSAACVMSYMDELKQEHVQRPDSLSRLRKVSGGLGRLLIQAGHKLEVPADAGHDMQRRYV